MKTKTARNYIDQGFGFPIILDEITLVYVRGKWTPKINYVTLAKEVLGSLAELDGRLSGNQIKFIRNYFELTLQQFAHRFNVTHPAVKKWEGCGNKSTSMSWSTEKDIRLFIKKNLLGRPKEFMSLYSKLETPKKETPVELRLSAEAVAA